jgi:hypothetical protein
MGNECLTDRFSNNPVFKVSDLGFVVTENGIVSDPQIPVGLGSGNLISGTVSK